MVDFFNVNLFLREVELTCNVVLASDLQQVDSIIFFFFPDSFHFMGLPLGLRW